jgi:hypothetical protein
MPDGDSLEAFSDATDVCGVIEDPSRTWPLGACDRKRPLAGYRVGSAAVELDWVLFDADGVIQVRRKGWMERDCSRWAGRRAEEFLLAIAAPTSPASLARISERRCGGAAAIRDQCSAGGGHRSHFWIEVRQPMLDAVRAVRDLGLRCGLATNQQNLRGGYMRSSLGFEEIFDEQFYSYELGLPSLKRGTSRRSWTAST